MKRRLALTGGLVILSALVCAPRASAQSVNVDASGTIAASCQFGTPTTGTLGAYYSSGEGRLTSFSGVAPAAAHSTVTITCNGPTNLTIAPPSLVTKPAAYTGSLTNCSVAVVPTSGTFGSSTYNASSCTTPTTTSGNFVTNAAGTTGDLKVSQQATLTTGGALLPPGVYTMRTTLTAVP
ncbi:hypothetical protein [Leptolyngbya sp. NIES-2104]|uniref:hypothetical protein n=1 Tax=Leptolyngbya sp. NIES-2104 TaxID=1552121 RepID=UPI000A8FAE7B|nr:hypothetical protein [Leptolyngbya sp. NIES-2104]